MNQENKGYKIVQVPGLKIVVMRFVMDCTDVAIDSEPGSPT